MTRHEVVDITCQSVDKRDDIRPKLIDCDEDRKELPVNESTLLQLISLPAIYQFW